LRGRKMGVSWRVMLENLFKSLTAAKDRAVVLERSVAKRLHKELRALPKQYGFNGVEAFIEALETSSAGARSAVKPKAAKRRKRTTITADIRDHVKKLIEAGKTGAEIAKTLKISLPSVQNIKKALGLVTPKLKVSRKRPVSKAPAKAKILVKKPKKKASRKPAPSEPVRTAAKPAPESAEPAAPAAAKT
jgi:hypothetical protein